MIIANTGSKLEDVHPFIIEGKGHTAISNVEAFSGNNPALTNFGVSYDFMSLMFPTIYALGIHGLGEDTKIGGAGMVMAIAGAAVLTQIQGIVSDEAGSITLAYWVPAIAFIVVGYYSLFVAHKQVS